MTLAGQLGIAALVVAASVGLVALGVLIARRLKRQSAPIKASAPTRREPAPVDPRPLPESPASFAADREHRGEAWLAVGRLPVSARQLALVLAKLPIGTTLTRVEPDPVNGEGCLRLGFVHWSFAAPDAERHPNGPRLWVSWSSEEDPIVSWPTVGE